MWENQSHAPFVIGLAIAVVFPVALLKAGRRYINSLNKTKEK
ncbi:conserved domain protein (plasmid) [Yersinia pestis Angola]|nr:conserved domain protein [Yersinia pestis Angola]